MTSAMVSTTAENEVTLEITRDPEYYYPTGDCTLLVDNILFKVRIHSWDHSDSKSQLVRVVTDS